MSFIQQNGQVRAKPMRSLGDYSMDPCGYIVDPQLGITKASNIYLRSLLVECANHILGPRGKDSTLRRWGLHLGSRGGQAIAQPSDRCGRTQTSCSAASHLGYAATLRPVLCRSGLRSGSCSTVVTPRPDDCVSGWAFTRPAENWQHRLLLLTPSGTEP